MAKLEIYPINKYFQFLLELYPPVHANKFLPEWYKKQKVWYKNKVLDTKDYIEPSDENFRKAKNCPAIQETINDGIIIPAWSDIYIHKHAAGDFTWSTELGNINILSGLGEQDYIKFHPELQVKEMELNIVNNYGLLKLISPYYFKTEKGYGLEFSDPFYHHRRNIKILGGKVESDIWHEVNHPFEFYYDMNTYEEKSVMVKAGDPLFMIKPYKKEKEKIDLVLNDWNEDLHLEQAKNFALLSSVSSNWHRYKAAKEN